MLGGTLSVAGVTTLTGGTTSPAGMTALSGTAVPTTATAVSTCAPITMFSSGIKIWVTSDVPTHTATKGDLCINTGGTTNWIAFTTAT